MLKKIAIGLIVVVAGLWLAKNIVAKTAVVSLVKAMTGLQLQIDDLDVGVVNTRLAVKGLRVNNPTGFRDPVMINIPEIAVDYDLPAFFQGRVHLEGMRLHLGELVVERNPQGELNLNSLSMVKSSQAKPAPKGQEQRAAAMPMAIDLLELQIGRVVYKDYGGGRAEPVVQEFPINLNRQYRNITNPMALGSLIVSEALARTTLARLTGFDVAGLQQSVQQLSGGLVTEALGATKQVEGVSAEVLNSAEEAVSETTNALKKLIPVPERR